MLVNAINKTISLVIIFLGLLSFSVSATFAQSVPGPQFPSQPQVPPCVQCDEFFVDENDPSPTPQPTAAPTADPNIAAVATSTPELEDGGVENPSLGGQVLALSDTSAEESSFVLFTLLGLVCISIGMRLYRKASAID